MFRSSLRVLKCGECLGYLFHKKFHSNATKVLYASFGKDLPNPNLPTPLAKAYSHDTDILLEQINKARTIERILDISDNHLDVMNVQHIVTSLQSIHDLTKERGFNPEHLMDNRIFQAMCSRLMKIIRLLDSQDLITVYKVLSAVGVRNNAYVMQSILKMLGGHLNNMELGQLTFLNFLLSKQKHNTLVDGLRLAIPLVLQVQIEQQLDSDNISQVVDCLQLACRSRLKPFIIQKIVGVVLEKAKMLSHTNAMTVIFSLLNIDAPVDGYRELLNYSLEIVTKNMDLLERKQIMPLLRLCRAQVHYYSPFCFEVSKKIVTNNWDLESTWEVVNNLNKLGFCPPSLIDHLVNVISSEATEFRSSPSYSILNCVEYLTATGYHPPNVMEVLTMLCMCEKKLENLSVFSPSLLVKFVSCLGMMGCFPQNLLSQILNEEFLYLAWSKSRKQGRDEEFERNLLSLICSFELYEQQNNYFIPSSVLKRLTHAVCERHANVECPLEKFIQNGLGGTQFLQSGVFTKDGLFIDHALGMRSGNYPVSLQQYDSSSNSGITRGTTFVEDLILPGDAKIVTVIVAHQDHYCRDPEVLTGWMDLKIRSLSKKKLSPVVINYNTWKSLPDREKIPYLMREIKQAVQEEQCGKTNSYF